MKKVLLAATLLLLAAAAGAQLRDIEVALDYADSVGGIRLTFNGSAILDDPANLSAGDVYGIRYKIRNNGNLSEKTNITVAVCNVTCTEINRRSRTVSGKDSIYLEEKWTVDLANGTYWIQVEANVSGDENVSNNLGTRNISVAGAGAPTSTTTTTEPEERDDSTTSTTEATTTSTTWTSSSTEATSTTQKTTTTTFRKASSSLPPGSSSSTESPTTRLKRTWPTPPSSTTTTKPTATTRRIEVTGDATALRREDLLKSGAAILFVISLGFSVLYLKKKS